MGRPVIVDDGGSVRIRLDRDPGDAGNMDSLLYVNANDESLHSRTGTGSAYEYTKATVAWVEKTEIAGSGPPPNINVAAGTQAYSNFRRVVISTDHGPDVELTRDRATNKISIKVSGRRRPFIEPRFSDDRWGYIVANCGGIREITCDGQSPHTGSRFYIGVVIS